MAMVYPDPELSAGVLRYAAQGVLRFLENSDGWHQLALAEDQFHTGDDPIVADADAHAQFTRFAMTHPAYQDLRVWGIVGEENILAVPKKLEPGARLIVVDPLDGSRPWAMIRAGYCVAALTLVADNDGGLEFESAVVSGPIHTFTLIGEGDLRFGSTFAGPSGDVSVLSTLPENPVINPSVAFTGHKTRDRRVVQDILTGLPDWSVFTLGGNPVTPYVVVGGLTAAVTFRPQCTWDAIAILMATATDAVVGSLDGLVVSNSTFQRLFNKVLLTGNVRAIPPLIVAKTDDRYQEVSSAMRGIALGPEQIL